MPFCPWHNHRKKLLVQFPYCSWSNYKHIPEDFSSPKAQLQFNFFFLNPILLQREVWKRGNPILLYGEKLLFFIFYPIILQGGVFGDGGTSYSITKGEAFFVSVFLILFYCKGWHFVRLLSGTCLLSYKFVMIFANLTERARNRIPNYWKGVIEFKPLNSLSIPYLIHWCSPHFLDCHSNKIFVYDWVCLDCNFSWKIVTFSWTYFSIIFFSHIYQIAIVIFL